jgi:hypothetical protein
MFVFSTTPFRLVAGFDGQEKNSQIDNNISRSEDVVR